MFDGPQPFGMVSNVSKHAYRFPQEYMKDYSKCQMDCVMKNVGNLKTEMCVTKCKQYGL